MNLLNVHSHLLHDFHSIAETKDDTFLCGSYNMRASVLVET